MDDSILSRIHIQRHSAKPIYQQLHEQLEALILAGTWNPDVSLPSENRLAKRLAISVMTVRQAMNVLVSKHLIVRERGRGTFVLGQVLAVQPTRLDGFTVQARARALVPSGRILAFEHLVPPPDVAKRLALAPDCHALYIRRLRLINDEPALVQHAYLARVMLTREELERSGSLYTLLAQRDIRLVEAEEAVQAVAADEQVAQLLDVPPGTPLMQVERTVWNHNHEPVEFGIVLSQGNRFPYRVRLRR